MKELTALQDNEMGLGLGNYASGCKACLYLRDMVIKFKSKLRPRLTLL